MREIQFAVALALLSGVAHATPIPSLDKAKTSTLDMRVLHYAGSSNGELTVEISNRGAAAAEFDAQGLYFVPNENADNAPQRVGAVGPLKEKLAAGTWETHKTLSIPAGEKRTLRLDVYCIDHHRRSPQTGDKFTLAGSRMPRELATEIHNNAQQSVSGLAGGYAAPMAKSNVQQEVWKARDKKWIKLDGEGQQEATK